MVLKPDFKLTAKGKDITEKIKANLIEITFDDKEGKESDEISVRLNGLYAKPMFGDSLELYLGYVGKLFKCGSFNLQTVTRNYMDNTTEIRATSVNFASPQKKKKTRTWEKTTLFNIATTIAKENGLKTKLDGEDQQIISKLQKDVNDLEFLYGLAFEFGFLMKVRSNSVIISKNAISDDGKVGNDGKGGRGNGPKYTLNLTELSSLEITEANRNSYDKVIVEWQDTDTAKSKKIEVGEGKQIYRERIAAPKSDSEAFAKAKSKLASLKRGGISGSCSLAGADIKAGGNITFIGENLGDIKGKYFAIKSVNHTLNSSSYLINIEFEG